MIKVCFLICLSNPSVSLMCCSVKLLKSGSLLIIALLQGTLLFPSAGLLELLERWEFEVARLRGKDSQLFRCDFPVREEAEALLTQGLESAGCWRAFR